MCARAVVSSAEGIQDKVSAKLPSSNLSNVDVADNFKSFSPYSCSICALNNLNNEYMHICQ